MNCPDCDGNGGSQGFVTRTTGCRLEFIQCRTCAGTGEIAADEAAAMEERRIAGRALRAERMARDESLGEAAARLGISPMELSAKEHGR